jgi:hypothetical protein
VAVAPNLTANELTEAIVTAAPLALQVNTLLVIPQLILPLFVTVLMIEPTVGLP